MNLIAWSIPGFIVFIALEFVLARRRGRDVYRLPVAISDINCGVLQQLAGVLTAAAFVALYVAVYRWRVVELDPRAVSTWVFGMIAVDFLYYWWHRASHEVGLLWAGHVVHHHSEDYNLAVALRQGIFTKPTFALLGLSLALLGLPPVVYLTCEALNLLYQFWIHTELVGPLGPLERVLNTPVHHRVHHAVNPRYLDRNYGGILIVWDRLFGTFAPLDEAPVYGTTRRLLSLNPLWAQLAYFRELAARVRASAGVRAKLWALVAHPSWWVGRPVPTPSTAELGRRGRFSVPVPSGMLFYVCAQMAGLVVLTMTALIAGPHAPLWLTALGCAAVAGGAVALAGLMERRPWAVPLEVGRLAATVAVGLVALRG